MKKASLTGVLFGGKEHRVRGSRRRDVTNRDEDFWQILCHNNGETVL
jgi:hypothetical protein